MTGVNVQAARPQSEALEVSRALAAALAPGRHALSSRRLEREYGEAQMTPSVRARIAAELDHAGLLIVSDPCHEPLVVVKRTDQPTPAARASASHDARRLKVLADRAADEVARSGRPAALPPMSDAEREIAREHLRWRVDLVARSEGEGPERHVVVLPI